MEVLDDISTRIDCAVRDLTLSKVLRAPFPELYLLFTNRSVRVFSCTLQTLQYGSLTDYCDSLGARAGPRAGLGAGRHR